MLKVVSGYTQVSGDHEVSLQSERWTVKDQPNAAIARAIPLPFGSDFQNFQSTGDRPVLVTSCCYTEFHRYPILPFSIGSLKT